MNKKIILKTKWVYKSATREKEDCLNGRMRFGNLYTLFFSCEVIEHKC